VRERAVQLVQEARGPDAVDLLIEALDDGTREVQMAAVVALRDFPEPRSAPALLKTCFAPTDEVARAAAGVLGFPRPPDELDAERLMELFHSPDPRTRLAAAHYAVSSKRTDVAPVLAAILREGEPGLRALASERFTQLADQMDSSLPARHEAARALLELAASGERESRLEALRALRGMARGVSVADLAPLCGDPDPGIAREAVEVVGTIGGVAARDLVRKLLQSGVPAVRLGAVNALLSFDRPAYAVALAGAAKDQSELVRFGVAEGLTAGAPTEAYPAIAALLADPVPNVRLAAVGALARSGNVTSLGLLAECAASPSPETAAAASEFVRANGGAVTLGEMILTTPSASHYDRARAFLRLNGLSGFDCRKFLRAASEPYAGAHYQVARDTLEAIAEMGSLLRASGSMAASELDAKELLRSAGPGATDQGELLRAPLPDWVRSDEELLEKADPHGEGIGGLVRHLFGEEEAEGS
jgi:HEAT repeat protein